MGWSPVIFTTEKGKNIPTLLPKPHVCIVKLDWEIQKVRSSVHIIIFMKSQHLVGKHLNHCNNNGGRGIPVLLYWKRLYVRQCNGGRGIPVLWYWKWLNIRQIEKCTFFCVMLAFIFADCFFWNWSAGFYSWSISEIKRCVKTSISKSQEKESFV